MKYRTNITASSNKRTPAHARARYRRATLRRSRIENGVVRVQFIKILPPAAPNGAALPEPDNDRCRWCGCPTDPGEYCEICGWRNPSPDDLIDADGNLLSAEDWAAGISLGGITPPWTA